MGARENDTLETLCKARGLIIEHPREGNRVHLHTDDYKARQQLTEVQQEIERYTEQIKTAKELQAVGKTAPQGERLPEVSLASYI